MKNSSMWQYQTADGLSVHEGYPTDARGLRLRAQCGYTHVHRGCASGWLQIKKAIEKQAHEEAIAALQEAA